MGTLLLDNFVGVNGTHLAAHTPDVGGPWVDGTAGWQIQSNHAKQTVDVNESHVEVGRKIEQVSCVANFAGCDPSNSLVLILGNDAGTEQVFLKVSNGPFLTAEVVILVTGDTYECDVTLPPTFDPAVDHAMGIVLGPDSVTFTLDGAIWAKCPRQLPKTFAATRVTLQAGALNALPGIVVKQIILGF